jgi:hypothetical protein
MKERVLIMSEDAHDSNNKIIPPSDEHNPLEVECPFCLSQPFYSCISTDTQKPMPFFHIERRNARSKPLPSTRTAEDEGGCEDCGRPYPHGLDMVLTKKQWVAIYPEDSGVLCPSCIVNRAARLPGSIAVYAHIVKGEHYDSPDSLEGMILALREENADYAAASQPSRTPAVTKVLNPKTFNEACEIYEKLLGEKFALERTIATLRAEITKYVVYNQELLAERLRNHDELGRSGKYQMELRERAERAEAEIEELRKGGK